MRFSNLAVGALMAYTAVAEAEVKAQKSTEEERPVFKVSSFSIS